MKPSPRRIRPNGKPSVVPKQVQESAAPPRNGHRAPTLPEQEPAPPGPARLNGRQSAAEALFAHRQDPATEILLPVNGLLEVTDAEALSCLDDIIVTYMEHFWQVAVLDASGSLMAASDGELLAMVQQLRFGAPQGRGPIPETFALGGMAGNVKLDGREMLFLLASLVYRHRDFILKKLIHGSDDPIGKIELSEALVIAEAIVSREGLATELDEVESFIGRTKLQMLAWEVKAEHYRSEAKSYIAKMRDLERRAA